MQQLFFASVFLRDCMRRGAKLLDCCIAITNLPCIYNRRKIGKCWRKSSKGLKQSNASIHKPSNLANRYDPSIKPLHQLCIDSLWKFGKDTLNVQFTHPYHKNTPSPGVGANEIQQEGNSNGNKTNHRPVPLPRKSTSPLGD